MKKTANKSAYGKIVALTLGALLGLSSYTMVSADAIKIAYEPYVKYTEDGSLEYVDLEELDAFLHPVKVVKNIEKKPSLAARVVNVVGVGSLINSPGTGAGGADESILDTASGMTTIGFGNQKAVSNRIADDFTLGQSEKINTVTFYQYQAGSTTASTITEINLRIWDGVPGAAGSTVVFGDTATNRIASTTWSNVYRINGSALSGNVSRPIMEVVVTINTILPAGTYWLDWQADGTLASGPYAPPIVSNGFAIQVNGMQSVDGGVTYATVADHGTGDAQGFPFKMDLDAVNVPVPVFSPLGLLLMVSGFAWYGRRKLKAS